MTIGLQRPLKIPPPSTSRTNIQGCLVPLPESILESSKGLTRTGFLICAGKTALRGFLRLIQNVTGPYIVPGRPEYHSCAWGASVLSLHKLTLSYVTPLPYLQIASMPPTYTFVSTPGGHVLVFVLIVWLMYIRKISIKMTT